MNETSVHINQKLLAYQSQRLRELIVEMMHCCEDRKLFESQKFALPQAELKCLMLFNGERYLTVKGIAERLDVTKSRVTKIVNGLMAKGLVRQINDPKDGRVKLISKSPVGQRKSQQIEDFYREIHCKILLELDDEERRNVLFHLELLRSAMEAVKEQLI